MQGSYWSKSAIELSRLFASDLLEISTIKLQLCIGNRSYMYFMSIWGIQI